MAIPDVVTDLPITIVAGTLPSGAVYNPQTYFNAIVARMTATVSGGNFIFGQLGGGEPTAPLPGNGSQAGLWFGNPDAGGGHGYWNDWNTDAVKYLPIPLVCGQYISGALQTTEFVCGARSDQTITTPDASGTMALTSDLIQQLGTQTYSGITTLGLDWDNRAPAYVVMTTPGLTINNVHQQDGMIMDIYLENRDGSGTYTIAVTGAVWNGGTGFTPPALSTGVASTRVIDHLQLEQVAGIMFAYLVAKDHRIPIGTVTTVPVFVDATGSGNIITVDMSAVLLGLTLDVTKWFVLVNGNDDNVTSATANGTQVSVHVATSIPNNATCTIRYAGTDLKSLAGVAVVAFGPKPVDLGGDGGGIHNSPHGSLP